MLQNWFIGSKTSIFFKKIAIFFITLPKFTVTDVRQINDLGNFSAYLEKSRKGNKFFVFYIVTCTC
jgi:hypothetical protein